MTTLSSHTQPCARAREWLTRRFAPHQVAYHAKLGISVEQHYFSRYKRERDYAHLPCVIEYGDRGHRYFYPLEVAVSKFLAFALD